MSKHLKSGLALILPNKKINLFVIFIIILGIISGSIFLVILNSNDKNTTTNIITNFMSNINSNNIDNFKSLTNSLIENSILILLIWFLGMSMIGTLFSIFIIYIKGFTIGFSISSFILAYKYKGIIASIFYLLPGQLISLLSCILLSVYTILFSKNIFKLLFLKEKNINFGSFFKKYLLILGISIFLLFISSLSESYLFPSLLKLVIKLFI